MIIDPYQTTLARPHKHDVIRKAVVQAALADSPSGLVFTILEEHTEVPSFTQPMLFETPGNAGQRIAVDARQYRGTSPFVKEQLDQLEMQAALTLYGAREGGLGAFYHPVASVAYATILSGLISQRFGIDPRLKVYVAVVAAAHYYDMTHERQDSDLPMLTQAIMRDMRLGLDIVGPALDKCVPGDTMEALCANIRAVDDTDRTKALVPGLLINSASQLSFGINSQETIGVAFEHAPTFCTLLFNALGDGSYSRGEIAKRLKYVNSVRQKAEPFRKSMRTIQSEISHA